MNLAFFTRKAEPNNRIFNVQNGPIFKDEATVKKTNK